MTDNRKPTKMLFKQFNPEGGTECLEDWRRRFVSCADPTEYAAAIDLVGGWKEWQSFKKQWKSFREEILIDWLAEVEVKLRSESIRNLTVQAMDSKGAAAAKWLAEGKYKPNQVGRPSNAEVEKQAKIQSRINDEVEDDILRVSESLNLKLVG